MVRLSVRLHLGAAWGGTTNPCVETCAGYNLTNLTQTCVGSGTAPCVGTFTIDADLEYDTGDQVVVSDVTEDDGWNGTWQVATVDPATKTFTVNNMPQLKPCSGKCGVTWTDGFQENFTLAGGTYPDADTTHPYYTLHADF